MDFKDILHQARVPFADSGKDTRVGWLNFKCPWCNKNPYMGYNIARRSVNCWSCGWHPLDKTIALLLDCGEGQARDFVRQIPQTEVAKAKKSGKLVLPDGLCPLLAVHRDYLLGRGLKPSTLWKLWRIEGLGLAAGVLKWRIFIPVQLDGETVSWTTRAIGAREPRYWSAKDDQSAISIDNLLYGWDYVRNSVVICEGPVDVWKIGPGAVAVLGQRTSPARLEQLSQIPRRYVCFDNEPMAQVRARKLMADLSVFDGSTTNAILDAKDPGSAGEAEIQQLRGLLE